MPKVRSFWIRLLAFLHLGRKDDDFEAELESHILMQTEDGIRAGLKPEEARRQALMNLGVEQTRQAYRERSTLPLFESVVQDVRFSLRQLCKAPGFTITAVLTLALGIGANTVIYTLVDSILLRPLPYARQDLLMRITGSTMPVAPKGWIRAMSENSKSFSSVAAYGADTEFNYSDTGSPDRIFGTSVTTNAFDALGIHPALGEFFSPDDAIAGRDNKVVLSYGYWQQRYGGSKSVIGQSVKVDGTSRQIIGVMPPGIHFPYADTQFVIPVSFNRSQPFDPWINFDLHAFGRLMDGVDPLHAQSELRRLHDILLPSFPFPMPDIWASDMTVTSLLEEQTGATRPRLLLLSGAVGLILLIACANVANLMLARSTSRVQEMAIRSALGASIGRLFRQLLCESIILGLIAGTVAMFAAAASIRLLPGMLPADTPRIQDVAIHAGEVLFTFVASLAAGILFGILPAIRLASESHQPTLRSGSRGLTNKGASKKVSTLLVVAQIGLSVVVIISAGLMLHSLYKISQVDPGIRTEHIVTAEVALNSGTCKNKGRCNSFFQTLVNNAQGISGAGAAMVDSLPFSNRDGNYVYDAENHPRQARQGALVATGRVVSPQFFKLLGFQLLQGRFLTDEDSSGTTHGVLMNEQMAQRLWPGQNPIGKHVIDVGDEPSPAVWGPDKASVVVGVVRNTREKSLNDGFRDEIFVSMSPALERPVMYLLVRTQLTTAETANSIRRTVAAMDNSVPVTHVRALDEIAASSVAASRALAVLLLAFGSLAVLIGSIGVYSLMSCIVTWRTGEIGLRLALGAQRRQVELAFIRQSVALGAFGIAAGMGGALALGRLMRQFLFEVSPLDPITFAGVAILMLLVTLTAAWVPARRAAALDPILALRGE